MVVSSGITKAIIDVATPVRCKLAVDDEIVEKVTAVGYSRVTITSYDSTEKETNCHIIKAHRISENA